MAKKILIIDDEKDMRVYLETLFKKAGYETASAADGEEGLARAREYGPDLITLDVLMPKKSGLKAYRGLRTSPETADTPIVVLTGLTRFDEILADLEDLPKPEAMMEKPIDREEFLARIGEILG